MTTRTIPQEYLAFRQQDDFGFSAIDETEVNRTVDPNTLQETIIVRESITQSSESIQRVEDKLDQMLSLYNDGKLGLEAERDKMEAEVKKNLKTLEQLIMPLLVNLMKNPEKEYIYWPNRTAKIQEQIDKVLTLTRG
jgi:CRISPR/Cas system-associated protein Cas10 (large subunit of type III CRISPR-Cas system)